MGEKQGIEENRNEREKNRRNRRKGIQKKKKQQQQQNGGMGEQGSQGSQGSQGGILYMGTGTRGKHREQRKDVEGNIGHGVKRRRRDISLNLPHPLLQP